MKILLLFVTLLTITGCNQKTPNITEIQTTVNITNQLEYEVYSDIKLHDLLAITNGDLITENYNINTKNIGTQTIKFTYIDANKQEINSSFNINIVDKTKPIIMSSNNFYLEKGKKFEILDDIVCGDNYDRNPTCSIIGTYDTNKTGEYNLKISIIDSSGNTNEKDIKLIVKDKIKSSSSSSKYKIEDLIRQHKNENTEIGIDVSAWQDDINWQKVKNAGVEFVIIRIGYGHSKGELKLDKRFNEYIEGAKKVGLKVGVYFYSYAKNEQEAIQQANWITNTLNGTKLELPIAFDWEDWSDFNDYNINFHDLNSIAKAFLSQIEKKGYKSMNYGSASYFSKIWNTNEYPTWLAHYTDKTDYEGNYYIWQLSSKGKINGINTNVDLNILYKNKINTEN